MNTRTRRIKSIDAYARNAQSPKRTAGLLSKAFEVVDELVVAPEKIAVSDLITEEEAATILVNYWEHADLVPVGEEEMRAASAAACWLRRQVHRHLLAAVLVGYALNEAHYDKPQRNRDCLFWFMKTAMRNTDPSYLDAMLFERAAERIVLASKEIPTHEIEKGLRGLAVRCGSSVIPLTEDARINALLARLDPANDIELRSLASTNKDTAGLLFIFGAVIERNEKYTLMDEFAISANVIPNALVSGSDFLKGGYAKEILIRERCVRSVIRASYIERNSTDAMTEHIIDLLYGITGGPSNPRFMDLMYRIEIRSVHSYRDKEFVKHETTIRDQNLESVLAEFDERGPLFILKDLSVSVTELLAVLEILEICERTGADSLEIAASLLCEIRDNNHASSGDSWYYRFTFMSVACLLFLIRWDRSGPEIGESIRRSIGELIDSVEDAYEETYTAMLRYLNAERNEIDGLPCSIPTLVERRQRREETDDATWTVLGTFNMYYELLGSLSKDTLTRLRAAAEVSYMKSFSRLARVTYPRFGQVNEKKDLERLESAIRARARELAQNGPKE